MLSTQYPVHQAAAAGDLIAVKRLVEQGRDLNAFDELGSTPLHYAVEGENFEVAAFLIEAGANVNAHHEPIIGETPLGAVAGRCSLRMARLLVNAGADPTIRGGMQLTALDRTRARQRGDGPQVYALLVSAATRRNGV